MSSTSKAFINIHQLGFVFFFNFFSFFTLSSLTQTLVEELSKSQNISKHAGYFCGFLIYLIFSLGHIVATPIVDYITPKWSIVSGIFGYALYELSFLIINEPFMYFTAAMAGFSGSLLWTGQFDYLAQNCQPNTLDKNSSTLWGLTQISLIFGGIYLLIIYRFAPGDSYDMSLIRFILLSFLACTIISFIIAVFLEKPAYKAEKYNVPYFQHLTEIGKVSLHRNLLLLLFTFLYTGFELSFFSVVYPTMISFTTALGNNRDLNAISVVCVGIGSITGCALLSIMGERVRAFGRKNMVLLGFIVHISSFILIFFSFPDDSPLSVTNEIGYISPQPVVVILIGILLGIGDTIFNMQCYTIISDIYEHVNRIEAFAVYRFYQSIASCIAMFYSSYFSLKYHMVILAFFSIASVVTFFQIRVPNSIQKTQSSQLEIVS
ncbi:unnamed protein product [Caenorhabditis bovis]|uniref:MFS transporter n=1 Tax=Caenorhabditis bovis TaxID=2654633 RepID=A0A8S1E9B6_9PELO|nr:unnamed protein product [Caenorhabditis bovis]